MDLSLAVVASLRRFVGLEHVVPNPTGFEGTRGLEVLELEEDSAGGSQRHGAQLRMRYAHQPAAFDRPGDSIKGVSIHGLRGGGFVPFMMEMVQWL